MSNDDNHGTKPSSKPLLKRTPSERGYRHRSRLTDPITRRRKWRRPNALKHGAFSTNPAIPGETLREFRKLHSDLIDEWQPCGPTEEDAVYNLAYLIWRKRRGQKFVEVKKNADGAFDPRDPTYEDMLYLMLFLMLIDFRPELPFDECALALSEDQEKYVREKFPRSNYKSKSEWVEAVRMEVKSVLMPAALPEGSDENINFDINLHERLETMIHRQVKYLMQLKAMKQLLHQTSTANAPALN